MRKILFVFSALILALFCFAENADKIMEIGLTTTRPLYDSYNFTMKFGDEKSVTRISSFSLNDYISDHYELDIIGTDTLSNNAYELSTSFVFALGREYRKEMEKNFEFRYGMDFTFGYSNATRDYSYDTTYTYLNKQVKWSPGFQLVLGINYVLKDRIVFGVEFLPKLYYSYTKYDYERDYTDPDRLDRLNPQYVHYWRVNISSVALFSVSYRF